MLPELLRWPFGAAIRRKPIRINAVGPWTKQKAGPEKLAMHNMNQFKEILTITSAEAPPRRLNRWGWGLEAWVLAGSCAFKPFVGVVTNADGADGRAQAHATKRRTKIAVERMVEDPRGCGDTTRKLLFSQEADLQNVFLAEASWVQTTSRTTGLRLQSVVRCR
jgi:hypothetical protein